MYGQGSSQKKRGGVGGLVLRSKDLCGFSDHIKYILPQKAPLFGQIPVYGES